MSTRNISARPGRPCAECRRLKHKCDRQLPCSNCVKKGCSDICPEGTNSTGDGHRRFWSRTHELKDILGDLAARIAALEVALRASHAINASSTHRLLEDSLLKIKERHLRSPSPTTPPSVSTTSASSPQDLPQAESGGVVEALGSLAINRNGRTKYFGPAALATYFLPNKQPVQSAVVYDKVLDLLPPDVCTLASAFPLSMLYDSKDGQKERLATLRCFLPPPEDAQRYKLLYYMHGTFTTCPVPQQEFDDIIYPLIYEQPWGGDDHRAHHCLSVVFLICAIGAMVDPSLSPRNGEGAKYYQLACAALFGSRVIEDPTIEAVQALCLAASYSSFLRTSVESNIYRIEWAMIGMATRIAHTMGLHRDPESFDLPSKEVQRRRRLWWNLYGHDSWNSTAFSLPPALSSKHFDTKWPEFDDQVGANLTSAWRWSYCVDCIEPLQQQMTAVARPSYQIIMELDQKFRTHPIPHALLYRPVMIEDLEPAQFSRTFQRSLSSMFRDTALVLLHRSHCDRATDERPDDLLNHAYGTSVVAVYRSAWAVLSIAEDTYMHMPYPAIRMVCITHMVFTSVAALCSIITRCPTLTLVPDALFQLDKFYKIAMRYQSAEGAFQTISKLREVAHATYINRAFGANPAANGETRGCQLTSDAEQREPMPSRLGGKTCRIDYSNLNISEHEVSSNGMTQMGMGVVAVPLQLHVEEMHPHVMEYLQGLVV